MKHFINVLLAIAMYQGACAQSDVTGCPNEDAVDALLKERQYPNWFQVQMNRDQAKENRCFIADRALHYNIEFQDAAKVFCNNNYREEGYDSLMLTVFKEKELCQEIYDKYFKPENRGSKDNFSIHALLLYPEGDAAPPAYFDYQTNSDKGDQVKSDIFVNRIKVKTEDVERTYYQTIGWNTAMEDNTPEAGGYMGLQRQGNTDTRGIKNFIFSIWDPSTKIEGNNKSKHVYVSDKDNAGGFGGEGTGVNQFVFTKVPGWDVNARASNLWIGDEWYTFVVRAWDQQDSTYFGGWVYDEARNAWLHIATFNLPRPHVRFTGNSNTFVEDWTGLGGREERTYYTKNGYKHGVDNNWYSLDNAFASTINYSGCRHYATMVGSRVEYDGNEKIFRQTVGGDQNSTYTDSLPIFANLKIANPEKPEYNAIAIEKMAVSLSDETLNVDWAISLGGLPQFKYKVVVKDHENNIVAFDSAVCPQQRSTSFTLNDLAEGSYSVELTVGDILDMGYATSTKTVIKEVNIPDEPSIDNCDDIVMNYSINPWGTMVDVNIAIHNSELNINVENSEGVVYPQTVFSSLMHGPHIHQMYVNTQNLTEAGNVLVIKRNDEVCRIPLSNMERARAPKADDCNDILRGFNVEAGFGTVVYGAKENSVVNIKFNDLNGSVIYESASIYCPVSGESSVSVPLYTSNPTVVLTVKRDNKSCSKTYLIK